jgi:hypothetical protein
LNIEEVVKIERVGLVIVIDSPRFGGQFNDFILEVFVSFNEFHK